MRYILDDEEYISSVYFGCYGVNCTEYTGEIPEGYESLEEWVENANIRAYKMVDGNLVYDAAKDYELQLIFEKEQYDNSYVTHKELDEIKIEQDDNLKALYDEQSLENSYFDRLITLNDCGNLEVEKIDIRANDSTSISNNIKMFFTSANLLPNEISDVSINGITFNQNTDKSINITGTSTSNCEISLAGSPIQVESIFYFLKDVKYYLNGLDKNISLKFYKYDGSDRNFIGEYTNESTITWTEDIEVSEIALYIPKGKKIDTTIYPMLQVSTETINTYVPYKENSLDISLGENTFEPGDSIVIESGEANLTKDRYIHKGSFFRIDEEKTEASSLGIIYSTLYFNFPEDLYKTLPTKETDIFLCGENTRGDITRIYAEDKKIYFEYAKQNGPTTVTIYDKENNINLSSHTIDLTYNDDNVYEVVNVTDSEVINYISLIPFEEIETINLGSVKMPSTYSDITNVYSNKDVLSKVTYRNSSKLNTNKIVLGTFEINDYGLKSKLTPPNIISDYDYDYTNDDYTKLQQYIMGNTDLTYTEKLLYDLNQDGELTPIDYVMMKNIIKTGVTHSNPGTLEINSNSPTETILLKDNEGNERANINLLGIKAYDFNLINEDGSTSNIKNMINENKTGKLLDVGTNLNDITTPGKYYGSDAGNYSNCPVINSGAFTFEVSKSADSVIRQVFHKHRENAGNRNRYSYLTFERYYTTNWTAWNCINGFINAYSDNGDYGWYRVLTLGGTSGYGDTSGIVAIKSSAVGPANALALLSFTYYNNGTPNITLLTGNLAPSRVKAIKKSDNSVDICVLTSSTYTNLGIEIVTLRMHNNIQTTPAFLGIESNLPSGTLIKCRQSDSNHYSSGDTYEINGYAALPGLLTGSAKSIHFTIFTPKDLSDISSITINSYNLDIRHPNGGYIATALTSVSGTIQALKRSPNIVDITITLNTATSFTNNTPVSVAVNSLKLTFN